MTSLAAVRRRGAAGPRAAASGHAAHAPAWTRDEVEDFLEEVEEYVEVRRKAREELPKLKDEAEPEDVTAYAKQLTTNIAAPPARARSRGTSSSRRWRAVFRRICRDELARSRHERKVVLTEGNPTGDEERHRRPEGGGERAVHPRLPALHGAAHAAARAADRCPRRSSTGSSAGR